MDWLDHLDARTRELTLRMLTDPGPRWIPAGVVLVREDGVQVVVVGGEVRPQIISHAPENSASERRPGRH